MIYNGIRLQFDVLMFHYESIVCAQIIDAHHDKKGWMVTMVMLQLMKYSQNKIIIWGDIFALTVSFFSLHCAHLWKHHLRPCCVPDSNS